MSAELAKGQLVRARNDEFKFAALPAGIGDAGEVQLGRGTGKPSADSVKAGTSVVGAGGDHGAPVLDDGEIVNEILKFGDQVSGDEHGAMFGISIPISADDRFHELTADDRIEARGWFIQDEQIRA